MTAVPMSCFALAPLFQKSDRAKSEIRKKGICFFRFSFFSINCPFFAIKTRQNDFFDTIMVQQMTCFCHFGPFLSKGSFFLIKRPFLSIKKFSLFSSTFSLFLIMVSVDHISFPSAGTGTTSYQVARDLRKFTQTNLFLNFFRLSGTGPRPTHCGPQGNSELCVQRADSTSDHCHCH